MCPVMGKTVGSQLRFASQLRDGAAQDFFLFAIASADSLT